MGYLFGYLKNKDITRGYASHGTCGNCELFMSIMRTSQPVGQSGRLDSILFEA